jgi:cbb3-type cytochrome oxidase subunit 3
MVDVNFLRICVTVVSFIVFIGVCWWALRSGNRQRFSEASLLPLEDDLEGNSLFNREESHRV